MGCFCGQFSFLTSLPAQGCAWPIRAVQQGVASGTAGSGVLGIGWSNVRECLVKPGCGQLQGQHMALRSMWPCCGVSCVEHHGSWVLGTKPLEVFMGKIVIRVTQQMGSFQAASFGHCWSGSLGWPGCLPQLWDSPGALTAVLGTVAAWASCWSSLTVLPCVSLQGTHLSTLLH